MNITVFCGANAGNNPVFKEKAIELGEWIVQNDHQLVYGGGNVGLMGVVADTVIENHGQVIGIMPTFLLDREIGHHAIDTLIEVETMSERKDQMIEQGDVFIALPGGPGTLEEIAQTISWARVGQNNSPSILMNVNGYYNHLEQFFDKMVADGFLSKEDRNLTLFSDDWREIEAFIENYANLIS